MKTITFLFLASLLVINNPFAQTPQESPALAQATALTEQFAPPREARVDRLDGKALKLPKPKYPVAARDRRLSGIVAVKLEIDEEGKVISATDMCQGPPYLTESALESAREARFTPVTINGQPVKVKGVIKYSFVAQF